MKKVLQKLKQWYLEAPCLCTNFRAYSDGHIDYSNKHTALDIFTTQVDTWNETVKEKISETCIEWRIEFTPDDTGLCLYVGWNILSLWSGMYYTH